jgi:signal transduction histidine kinase
MAITMEGVEQRAGASAPPSSGGGGAREALRRSTQRLSGAGGMDEDPIVATSLEQVDRVAAFAPAILALRWGTTIVSLALAYQAFIDQDLRVVACAGALLALTAIRTIHPLQYFGDTRSLIRVLAEVAVPVLAVIATGYWDSPFVFSLITGIVLAGFARGFAFSLRIAAVAAACVAIPELARFDFAEEAIKESAQWTAILLLVALVAGYARRISGEADRQHSLALDRLGRLADANALLYSLHRVTQTLPASFDMDEVLDTTMGRLQSLVHHDVSAVLLLDDTDTTWEVARADGVRMLDRATVGQLAAPLQRAIREQTLVSESNLVGPSGPGVADESRSGLYAPLTARGSLIGLLAIESREAGHFTSRDIELVNGFVEPAALALDNARWFSRLRTVGADEERTRIARDLHDRIGQSLAYLAFELDRIVSQDGRGEAVGASLEQLRGDVRGVIREVRDTLYDLRTDVSDSQDMATTIEEYGQRVGERSSLEISLHLDRGTRLPILQEREMWRICQEALTNIERHAEATRVRILWRCNGRAAALEVLDDGKGFPDGTAGRFDSYGILGMRERASSIGATLEMASASGRGTRVRCYLGYGEGAAA